MSPRCWERSGRFGLVRVLGRKADRMRDLAVAAVVARVVDLGTLTLNEVTLPGGPDHAFPLLATPTELQ